jgi:hypothetical protein
VQHKTKIERTRMKGFHAKPELIFFVIIAIILLLLFLGGAWLQGWLKGVTI